MLNHLALKVHDIELCSKFYSDILSLKIISTQNDDDGKLRAVWFDLGGPILMIEQGGRDRNFLKKQTEEDGWHLIALSIPKSERSLWKEKLCDAGIPIVNESSYSIYFNDPEGNRLALSHYPD